MSVDTQFATVVRLLTQLDVISRSTYTSDANLEFLQRELSSQISNMVGINRQYARNLRRAELQRMRPQAAATTRPTPTPPSQGTITRYNPLEKTKVIAKKKLEEPCPTECAICQETPKFKDAVCTDCNHYYCKTCWAAWMNSDGSNRNCPTCRANMPRTTSYKARSSPKPRPCPGPYLASRPVMIIEDEDDDIFQETVDTF